MEARQRRKARKRERRRLVSNVETRRRRAAKDAGPSSVNFATGRRGVADARSCFAICAKEDIHANQKQKKPKGSTRQSGMGSGGKRKENC